MAAELKEKLGLDCELIASHGGVFEISVNGKLVFSKQSQGRFPDDGEVVKLLKG